MKTKTNKKKYIVTYVIMSYSGVAGVFKAKNKQQAINMACAKMKNKLIFAPTYYAQEIN